MLEQEEVRNDILVCKVIKKKMVGTGRQDLVKFVLGVDIFLYNSSTERQQIAFFKNVFRNEYPCYRKRVEQ